MKLLEKYLKQEHHYINTCIKTLENVIKNCATFSYENYLLLYTYSSYYRQMDSERSRQWIYRNITCTANTQIDAITSTRRRQLIRPHAASSRTWLTGPGLIPKYTVGPAYSDIGPPRGCNMISLILASQTPEGRISGASGKKRRPTYCVLRDSEVQRVHVKS